MMATLRRLMSVSLQNREKDRVPLAETVRCNKAGQHTVLPGPFRSRLNEVRRSELAADFDAVNARFATDIGRNTETATGVARVDQIFTVERIAGETADLITPARQL